MSTVGRNNPCPCGSGRKFKHCCLRAWDAEDALRFRLRSAEGDLIPQLMSYALQEFGRDFFEEAWNEFFLWTDVPEEVETSRELGTTFDPFFVFEFVPRAAEGAWPDGWPTEPVALHRLRNQPESVPVPHREFIQQACDSPASFFVVHAISVGRSLDITDILTGRLFHVLEQTGSASKGLHVGDLLFTRVVTAGGGSIMLGACPWVIPASWHTPIIDMRERFRPKRLLTRRELLDHSPELRGAYHGIVHALLHPALPAMRNTDGDPLELTTLTYKLSVPVRDALERLTPLATLHGDVHLSDDTRDASGELTAGTLTWIKAGNRKQKAWDNTTLGTLHLDGSTLVVQINSACRRRRIEKEIAKCLGAEATLIDTRVTDWTEGLAQGNSGSEAGLSEANSPVSSQLAPPDDVQQSPEFQAHAAQLAREHWDAWFDTKVPALGNRTPRQAAKTAMGRERLEALLAGYAPRNAQSRNPFDPDIPALKQKLGLI